MSLLNSGFEADCAEFPLKLELSKSPRWTRWSVSKCSDGGCPSVPRDSESPRSLVLGGVSQNVPGSGGFSAVPCVVQLAGGSPWKRWGSVSESHSGDENVAGERATELRVLVR